MTQGYLRFEEQIKDINCKNRDKFLVVNFLKLIRNKSSSPESRNEYQRPAKVTKLGINIRHPKNIRVGEARKYRSRLRTT
jgi:hypothetical protein